jgi:hypothetical protein
MVTWSRRIVILTVALLAGSVAAEAQGNWRPGDFGSVRVRLGLFEPAGDSQYWDDKFMDFTGSTSDFQDVALGFDYLWRTSRNAGVLFGTSFYGGSTTQAYRDYVDQSGRDIRHVTALDLWDLTAALVWRLGDRGIVPYLGIGGGFVYWQLEESGDFIDFGDPDLPILVARYTSSGWAFEGLGLVGLDVPLGYRWSFFAEGRYRVAEDELGGDLSGLGTLDLTGLEVAAGFSWNF